MFNLDNLRRGLARDSYASGGASTAQYSSTTTTADSELLASLSTLPTQLHTSLYSSLPALTHIYLTSLSTNSSILFPLPAKATFPTPSAQKSALEVLGLGKRRELAGRWVKGVVELIGWTREVGQPTIEQEKAQALARVLGEVESGDLYRPGQSEEAWKGTLPSILEGAVKRLEGIPLADASRRDATIEVLSSLQRLEYEVLDQELPRVLAVLSQTPASPASTSSATTTFLTLLLTHHSRSLTVPTLIILLSDALASSPYSAPNNLLTTPSFTSQLGRTISSMLSSASSIRSTWENLLLPITSALQPSPVADTEMSIDPESTASPSPAKKRKLSSTTSTSDSSSLVASAARLRILTTFIVHLPDPSLSSLVEVFKPFIEELVDSNLKDFVKAASSLNGGAGVEETPSKKSKKSKGRKSDVSMVTSDSSDPLVVLGTELLEARYSIVKRLNTAGLISNAEEDFAVLKSKRRDGLREVVEKGSKEAVIVAVRRPISYLKQYGGQSD